MILRFKNNHSKQIKIEQCNKFMDRKNCVPLCCLNLSRCLLMAVATGLYFWLHSQVGLPRKSPQLQNSVIGQHRGGGLKGAKARSESRSESRSEWGWIPWLVPHRSMVVAPSSSEQLVGPIPSLGWHLGAGWIKTCCWSKLPPKLMKNHKYPLTVPKKCSNATHPESWVASERRAD